MNENIPISEYKDSLPQLLKILDAADISVSDKKPSEWCEENRVMTSEVSSIPGPFSYDNSPYCREIVDCVSSDHPSMIIAVMKGAQLGLSTGLMEAGIGFIISESPGNILFMVGHDDLVSESMNKIDIMIDNTGLRPLIKSSTNRSRKTKSGDTDKRKEFPGGYLSLRVANHKALRNFSVKYGFIDDYDAMKSASKESGSTKELVEQRFASFGKSKKIFFISSPELKETSNINHVYELGDKRKYHIPCPECNEFVPWEWEIESKKTPGEKAGIIWELDIEGNLIIGSVKYRCQLCDGEYDDSNKKQLLLAGKWIPTAKPKKPQHYSYQISALYAPTYMDDWETYVMRYLEACPPNGKIDTKQLQTFMNVVLGIPYEPITQTVSAKELQQNIRAYEISTLPEKLSIQDGNGEIVMVTCGADLNGKEDDARLDFEIVAYSVSGATYSVLHGSIGTFIPRDKNPENREKWSYRHGVENSVWPMFAEIINTSFECDSDKRKMKIFITALDCGYMKEHCYPFVDSTDRVVGVIGTDDEKHVKIKQDFRTYKKSQSRNNLYLIETNYTKDLLAHDMQLTWNQEINQKQPFGFMNFPIPSNGLYLYENYFSHFEAEHKTVDSKTGAFRWVKRDSLVQNHLFDCRLYANVGKDIFLDENIFKPRQIRNGVWKDYVNLLFPDQQ